MLAISKRLPLLFLLPRGSSLKPLITGTDDVNIVPTPVMPGPGEISIYLYLSMRSLFSWTLAACSVSSSMILCIISDFSSLYYWLQPCSSSNSPWISIPSYGLSWSSILRIRSLYATIAACSEPNFSACSWCLSEANLTSSIICLSLVG